MTNLGKYEIFEELGIGSMGTVFRARDTVLDREIALKTIRAGSAIESEMRERFYREARACARLQHPNIITIYDFGEVDETAFISMELLVGEDLRKIIQAKRSIPPRQKMDLIAQVSDALAHAHKNGVVHRDIKPSNIFIHRENVTKVLDFGIARLATSQLTVLGRVLGTPNYMAPEQIAGSICDSRSDLFSLAIVFFELLTGVHPFQSSYIPRNIVNHPPAKLRTVDSTLPVALEEFFDKALQKSPEGRFQSADDFSAALKQLAGEIGPGLSVAATNRQPAETPAAQPAVTPDPALSNTLLIQAAEVRTSEFFSLMQECDSALEARLLDKCRTTLEQMKKLAALDPRFNVAVSEYQHRVETLLPPAPELPKPVPRANEYVAPPPPRAEAPTATRMEPATARISTDYPRVAAQVETETRTNLSAPPPPAATPSEEFEVTRLFSLQDIQKAKEAGERGSGSHTAGFPDTERTRPVFDNREGIETAPRPYNDVVTQTRVPVTPVPPDPRPLPKPAKPASQQSVNAQQARTIQMVVIGAGVLVIAALIALGVHFLNAPKYALLPPVGTANVISSSAALFAGPTTEKSLATLQRGAKVNVTHMPQYPNPEWIAVQQASDRPGPTGYVRASALGHWSTLSLLHMFDPGDSADFPRQIDYLDKLREGIPGFSETDRTNAWLEIARKDIAIAKAKKTAGAVDSDWQSYLGEARVALDKASSNRVLEAPAQAMKQEVAGLLEAQAPTAAPPDQPQPVQKFDAGVEYRVAENAYRDGQYARAVQLLRRILAVENTNQPAQALLQKVQKAAQEEQLITGAGH